ncbi:MAG: VOC family protein [Hyphomicrobiaceae bacterium]|nr:VOC family protein [Hyphomicrobiaceae bacterium]
MSKLSHCLWFDTEAEEAARFYVSLLPDSRIDRIVRNPITMPGGDAGAVMLVDFTLAGKSHAALNGGPHHTHSAAFSFVVACADQTEIDRLWQAIEDGGKPMACGWIADRYGVAWQIVWPPLLDMLSSPDRAAAARAMQAMLGMIKLDVAAIEAAYRGG